MSSDKARGSAVDVGVPDDLMRDVYCVLGLPIDAIVMPDVLRRIEAAATMRAPFLISTPNLNFLVNSQSDSDFRETLLSTDLCMADGMPVVWIAWIIGAPIKNRVAGSDMFDALRAERNHVHPLKVFLFGGAEGAAADACRALNAQKGGVHCVGSLFPGFASVDEMSRDDIINSINSSDADFLVASLGAQKGQLWLQRNHHRLRIAVRAHLGAVINFQAAKVRRAPPVVRKVGLEWSWRIKEEPYLWRRYWNDGRVLFRLLLTRIVPLAIWTWWLRLRDRRHEKDLVINQTYDDEFVTVSLSGLATAPYIDKVIHAFRGATASKKRIMIDFSNTRIVDARFLGLLLMLRKKLKINGVSLILIGLSPGLERIFHLNGLQYLLASNKGV